MASYARLESRKIGLIRRRRGLLRRSVFAASGVIAVGFVAAGPAAAAGPLVPSAGSPPTRVVAPSFQAPQFAGAGKAPEPATSVKARPGSPIRSPASVVLRPTPPAGAAPPGDRAAYWDGRQYRLNSALRAPSRPNHRLGIPTRQQAARRLSPFTPLAPSSVQVDGSDNRCTSIGSNEEQVAQSSINPDLVLVAAQAFSDGTDCSDSHPFVFYSHDGGQHWHQQVIPGLDRTAGGDPAVVFDPVRQVFVYSFTEFDRDANNAPINARIEAESSTDGTVWGNHVVLSEDQGDITTDKPMITVDSNPASPHYGRVEVTWTEFTSGGSVFLGDYTDSGGFSWQGANRSINTTASNCGNGTSPAFDANGELMTAYWSCNGGDSVREDLSTDGGASWNGGDVTISTIGAVGDPDAGTCMLNTPATGSQFRCNSFPSLAGDPNPSDAGGQAFAVVWANAESGIAQIRGVSTADAGASWTNPFFGAANNNGDKFFPWLSIASNGRVDIGYSSREGSVTPTNTKGTTFNEHHTDAASLARLRGGTSGEFVTYSIDDTPSDPGSLDFIGDYSGQASQDNGLDTYPVWTDLRDGSRHTRTSQLCYATCYTGLAPDNTLTFGHPMGSTFTDRFRFNTDPAFSGDGTIFWNVVGIRNGNDGTVIDNDMSLFNDRYFSSGLATSSFSPPFADYLLENDNRGHAPSKPYYLDVHSFETAGGTYSVQWDAGQVHLGSAETVSMTPSDIVRVFDSFDQSGSTVFIGLRPQPGNTSDYSLAIHSAAGPNTQGAPLAAASSGRVGFGNPAFVQYATGANPSDSDGVVVVNNNGGSGSYTLYRDTVAPTGTITINGGAASTKTTTLSLKLSATNATAGDPVTDMAFSVNGGSFGAFQPYSTSATVTVPAGEGVQIVSVEYRNGAGAVSAPASDTIYLVQTPPTVSSFTPTSGLTGSSVALSGAHFAPGATVKVGSLASPSVTFVSGTQINAVVPNGAVPGKIAVTTVAGTGTSATNFTPTLSITSFSPGGGPAGTVVTINGVGFNSTSTVKFNGTASPTVTHVSATQLKATVPAGATTGQISVTNTTGVIGTVKSAAFYAAAPPTVTSFTPASGSTGSMVIIMGTNFVQSATVKFGSLASPTVTFVSATQLTAIVPNGAVAGAIKVTTPAGTGTSATNFTPSLSITSFSPTSGPAGTVVTINGVGFNSTSTVKFNATAATTVTHVSATQLKATVPAGATTGQISVTNTTGVTGTVKSVAYYAVAAPTVSSFTPTSGITGSSVTINGTNFVPGAIVKFGTLASPAVTFLTTAQLKAVVPNGAVPATIHVTTPAGTGTSATNFTPSLSITSFSPTGGPVGTDVTINGVGFSSTSSVKFHGTTATTVTHVSATQLKATVPAGATTGAISVTNTTGVIGTVSSATSYTVT